MTYQSTQSAGSRYFRDPSRFLRIPPLLERLTELVLPTKLPASLAGTIPCRIVDSEPNLPVQYWPRLLDLPDLPASRLAIFSWLSAIGITPVLALLCVARLLLLLACHTYKLSCLAWLF